MRTLKHITAWMLAVCLLLTVAPFSALALEAGDFTYTVLEDGASLEITGYNGTDTAVVIPDAIDEKAVVSIGKRAFSGKSNLTSVTFPASLETIGSNAFEACNSLKEVTFPDSLKSIGRQAFFNCSSLSSISLSDNTFSIGYYAFHNTAWFINSQNGPLFLGRVLYVYRGIMPQNSVYTVPDFTAAIAPFAFEGQLYLKELYLPIGLRYIGTYAFANCSSLGFVRIPPSVISIDSNAFSGSSATIVNGVRDSSIYTYVQENEIYFEHDETLDYLDGDMNKNGTVDSTDSRLLMRAILGAESEYDHERFMSCNIVYDKAVDTHDLRTWLLLSIQ